jgi:hypothetical protein
MIKLLATMSHESMINSLITQECANLINGSIAREVHKQSSSIAKLLQQTIKSLIAMMIAMND